MFKKDLRITLPVYLFLFIFLADVKAKLLYQTRGLEMISRSTPYNPKVISKMCMLRPTKGPCRGDIDMWAFSPMTMNCTTFKWGGCQGNGNKFFTLEECRETCLSKPNPKNIKRHIKPKWCSLRFDYGYCFGDITRWYYDQLWGTCKQTIYSGCGGNKNNFYNKEMCDTICRFGNIDSLHSGLDDVRKIVIINPHIRITKETPSTPPTPTGDCDFGLTTSTSEQPIFSGLVDLLNHSTYPTPFYDLGIKAAKADGVTIDPVDLY